MSGGSLLINNSGASGAMPSGGAAAALAGMRIGNGSGGNGAMNVSGGALSVASGDEFYIGYNGATGAVTVSSGGTLSVGAGGGRVFIGGCDSGGSGGNGTLTVNNGGLVTVARGRRLPQRSDLSGRLRRHGHDQSQYGGTLSTARSFGTGGTSIINFNGGTLQAAASNSNFITAYHANVLAGGAIIDTQGYNVTIAQALLTGASPDGGLTKLGSGMLTLSAGNTYNGGTTVSGGTLQCPPPPAPWAAARSRSTAARWASAGSRWPTA